MSYIRGIYASASLKPHCLVDIGDRGDPYIRGIYASASLKRPAEVSLPQVSPIYPRHLRLGLIEATDPEVRFVHLPPIYPRHLRLGLIEACHSGAASHGLWEIYPRHLRLGLIEALLPIAFRFRLTGYPRHLRLGLIEASRSSIPSRIEKPNIRGIYASASLKQVDASLVGKAGHDIRGIYASASLKQSVVSAFPRKLLSISKRLQMKLDPCNGTLFLPIGGADPRALREIPERPAIRPVRLVANRCDILDAADHQPIPRKCSTRGTAISARTIPTTSHTRLFMRS